MVSSRFVGAGAFVLIGAALFTAALFMIGDRRMLFSDRFEVNTEFEKLGQLQVGAIVRVNGLTAGEVTDIVIPSSPGGKFRVKMRLRDDVHQLVRTDSVATAQIEGLVGAMFVNVSGGSERAPEVPDAGTIPSREPFAMADLLQQASDGIMLITDTVSMLQDDIQKAVQQVTYTVEDAHALVENISPDIKQIAENGNRLTADIQTITAGIRDGKGTIGKLMNDDALYERARGIADKAEEIATNVKQVSEEARRALVDFRSKNGPAQGLLADMRMTVLQTREATADLADNMEAMKHNFLLRGFFNRRGYYDLDAISPAEYRSGVLENGRRKAARIWLSADVLFERGEDGEERLSETGRERLDAGISTFLKHLPSNPLLVEGYATEGTVGEVFRIARHRAALVREYLLQRFDLLPQNTGYIALGRDADGSPRGKQWDGVALALFFDRDSLQFRNASR